MPHPLRLLRRLGSGSSSVVYLASLRGAEDSLVAAKYCSRRCFAAELSAYEALGRHPHILALLGSFEEPRVRSLLLEVMDGSLASHLARGAPPAREALALASCVSSALLRLSAVGLVHGDLRPANVLVRGRSLAKVADFGSSYWSPTCWRRDVRSLGLLLREMTAPPIAAAERLATLRPTPRPRRAHALVRAAAHRSARLRGLPRSRA